MSPCHLRRRCLALTVLLAAAIAPMYAAPVVLTPEGELERIYLAYMEKPLFDHW
jgi:hypothetical protein